MKYKHTNIIAEDWRKLAQFYIDIFNCKIVPPVRKQSGKWLETGTGVQDAELEGAHLLLPGYGDNGPTLEIYQYNKVISQEMVPANKRGFGHIAFETDDVEKILEDVLNNGGSILGEVTKKKIDKVGELTFVYMRDPEGNIIELQNWKK